MSNTSRARAAELSIGPNAVVLDPSDPRPAARSFLERHYTFDGLPTLYEQSGVPHIWTGTYYREAEWPEIRAAIWADAEAAKRWDGGKEPRLVPYQPTSRKVSGIEDALKGLVHLSAERGAPCWLDDGIRPCPTELVPLQNGLLHVPTGVLYPHTPRFFSRNALSFRYEPGSVPEPLHFLRFLKELWPDDPESIAVLQEIIGYLLTPDTRQQKAFLIVGPKRSGKGTLARVLRALIGERNVCAPTLSGLATNFGEQPLIGKLLAIISDARLGGRADQAAIAERLLATTGEDTRTIDRKHLPPWTGRLPTRFLILTNELPRLSDTSGALASRFVVLTLERSFYGREDPHLTDRLLTELPGIFHWALDGLDRLNARGHFVNPAASEDAIREMEDLGSPISAFIRDRCTVEPGRSVECRAAFEAWRSWCQAEGRDHAGNAQTFGRDLRAAVPGLRVSNLRVSGDRTRFYEGIDLSRGF